MNSTIPLSIEETDPELAKLLQWFCEENARRKEANLPPLRLNDTTIINEKEKVGRNDPCICGSEKKYKRCCWRG